MSSSLVERRWRDMHMYGLPSAHTNNVPHDRCKSRCRTVWREPFFEVDRNHRSFGPLAASLFLLNHPVAVVSILSFPAGDPKMAMDLLLVA